jgi:hypothetical protein
MAIVDLGVGGDVNLDGDGDMNLVATFDEPRQG